MKKYNKIKISLLISGILIALNVVVIALASANSTAYLQLEEDTRELIAINRELSESLVTETALVKIYEKAEDYNMAKPRDIVYLSQESLIAKLP